MNSHFPQLQFQQQHLKQEGVRNLQYPDILSSHFCWSIVGSPGSGKTTFIQNLLQQNELYNNKFDYVFIISPSNIKIDGVDQECCTKEFKIDWIYERLNYLIQKNIKDANLLLIFDDCISQLKQLQNEKMLIDLFFNRRHLWPGNTISIILTTQQFTMLPLRFRSVCDHFTFLSLSPKDFDFVKKELIYSSSRKCMTQVMETFQGQPHQFIYIRLQPFLLCQNFKPLIRGSTYVSLSNEFQAVQKDKLNTQQPLKKIIEEKLTSNFPAQPFKNQNQSLFFFNKK